MDDADPESIAEPQAEGVAEEEAEAQQGEREIGIALVPESHRRVARCRNRARAR